MSKSKKSIFNILLKFVLAVILIAASVFAGIVIDKRVLTKEQGSNSDITINKPSDNQGNNSTNIPEEKPSDNEEVFTRHYVTSSEIIKSKTYYLLGHIYIITDKEIIYGKTHFCVFDAFDDDNSSDNNSEKVNFKIIFTAYGRDNEFYFEAQQNTTWGSWCLSGNNNLKFGNSNYKFKVSEFDCITLPET